MNWLGIRDHTSADFSMTGIGNSRSEQATVDGILSEGSILLEFVAVPGEHDQILLNYRASYPEASRLQIRLDLEGVVSVRYHRGDASVLHQLETGLVTRSRSVTLRYTWSELEGQSALSVDVEESGECYFAVFDEVLGISIRDAVRITMDNEKSQMSKGTKFFALSDSAMPHGPLPTLLPDTKVLTSHGKKAVSDLLVGDLVVTKDGRHAQVRWSGSLILPARARFAPLRLCAPFHNARGDLVCSYDQQIRLAGNVVEYLFATEHVSAKVGHLEYGIAKAGHRQLQTIRYAQFVLDDCAATDVSGVHVEGMNIDHIQQNADLKKLGLLASLPSELMPNKGADSPPLLYGYEAANLSRSQAA